MMSLKLSDVDSVLLTDGWHPVDDGEKLTIEPVTIDYGQGDVKDQAPSMSYVWKSEGTTLFAPLKSVLALSAKPT